MNTNSFSPPKQSQHIYLSAIRDLQAADAEDNLKKKREQQFAFAESLKRQIEEKQRLKKQMHNHASTQPAYREALQRNEAHCTFGDNCENLGINKMKVAKPSQFENDDSFAFDNFNQKSSTYSHSKRPRKQILTKADLSQFDHYAQVNPRKENVRLNQNTIHINTDSPFASSTVSTPPQGFSMRKNLGIAQTQKISDQPSFASMYDTNDNYFSIFSEPTPNPKPRINADLFSDSVYSNSFDNPKPLPTPNIKYGQLSNTIAPHNAPKKNYRPPQAHPRAKSVLLMPVDSTNAQQLGGYSELIYPDGHFSPAVSPREF